MSTTPGPSHRGLVRDRRRAPVEDVTVLLLTHPGGPVCGHVLDALAEQTRRPDQVVLTGLGRDDDEVAQAREHPLFADRVRLLVRDPLDPVADDEPPLQEVVADAVADLRPGPGTWWWLLHDDSLPAPDALEQLVEATRRSTGVGVVGPKLVQAQTPRRLAAIGQSVTRGGRPGDSVTGQLDQGQYDHRSDVLGVPVAGMLVRADVFAELGGLDKAFGDGVEGLDLSWRSHLAGHRVLVAPDAVVRQGDAGLGLGRPYLARTRTRQLALARASWWSMPFRALAILVTSLLAAVGLLLVKRPAAAAGELADIRGVLSPWRGLGARWRFRGHKRVRRRDLSGLFASTGSAWRGTSDLVQDALTPRSAGTRRPGGHGESGPVDEDTQSLSDGRLARRLWSWPLTVGVVAGLVLALTWWRDLRAALGGSGFGVSGGDLWAVDADSSLLWDSWWLSWRGPGLGEATPAEPWLLPMAAASWLTEWLPWVDGTESPAAVTATWILFAALPLSVVSGYLAARAVLPGRWHRLLAGLLWAGLPPLAAAVSGGRLGPVVAHVLMPLVVAGFAASAGRRGDGSRRTAAAFGAALALGLTAMFVPGLLLLSTVAGLLLLVLGPGWGRLRGLVLALLPWALQGPWLQALWDDPRLLLGGAGATSTGGPGAPWQTLLLHPGGPQSPTLWWTAPLLVVALLAVARTGTRGRRAVVLLTGAVLSLAAALGVPLLEAGALPEGYGAAGETVHAWPGPYLSALGACVLLAAGLAVDRVARAPRAAAVSRPVVAVLGGVAAVAGLGLLATTVWAGTGATLAAAARPYPAVVAEQAEGAESLRMLELVPTPGAVSYRLEGREPGLWVRDRVRELSPVTQPQPGPGREVLDGAVNALVGQASPEVAADDAATQRTLHDLGVGFVGLRAAADHPLVEELDAVTGLTRLGGTEDLMLWRVAALGEGESLAGVGRLRVTDPDGEPSATVPVTGSHAGTDDAEPGRPAAPGTTLLVSEGQGWQDHARVLVDGHLRTADPAAWPLTYPLPDGAREVTVEVSAANRTWHRVTLALAVLTAFLALPLGGRSRRSG